MANVKGFFCRQMDTGDKNFMYVFAQSVDAWLFSSNLKLSSAKSLKLEGLKYVVWESVKTAKPYFGLPRAQSYLKFCWLRCNMHFEAKALKSHTVSIYFPKIKTSILCMYRSTSPSLQIA